MGLALWIGILISEIIYFTYVMPIVDFETGLILGLILTIVLVIIGFTNTIIELKYIKSTKKE